MKGGHVLRIGTALLARSILKFGQRLTFATGLVAAYTTSTGQKIFMANRLWHICITVEQIRNRGMGDWPSPYWTQRHPQYSKFGPRGGLLRHPRRCRCKLVWLLPYEQSKSTIFRAYAAWRILEVEFDRKREICVFTYGCAPTLV